MEQDVFCRGGVEIWLGELLREHCKSLHGVIREANRAMQLPTFELMNFMQIFIAQVNSVAGLGRRLVPCSLLSHQGHELRCMYELYCELGDLSHGMCEHGNSSLALPTCTCL